MNIFYLDHDPVIAARLSFDSHIVKMPLESMQMLSTNVQLIHTTFCSSALMKDCYHNHPCTIWARSSAANFKWLVDHTRALFAEYTKRYLKIHACQIRFENLQSAFVVTQQILNKQGLIEFTKPALAMPDDFKYDCPVYSYMCYYEYKKQMENFKVSMHTLACNLGMTTYANGKPVRKIALKMVHSKI